MKLPLSIFPWTRRRNRPVRSQEYTFERLEDRLVLSTFASGLIIIEPDDSIGQANPTGLPAEICVQGSATIGDGDHGTTTGDYDFFSISVEAGKTFTVDIDAQSLGSPLDPVVELFDSSGTLLASNDDSGGSLDSFLAFTAPASGTYYAAVHGFGSGPPGNPFTPGTGGGVGSTGSYRVTINLLPPDDFGNAFASANLLGLDGAGSADVSGGIEAPGDVDVFRFVSNFTGLVSISQSASLGSSLDSFLSIYDGSQTFLASNDDGGVGFDSLAQFPVTAGAAYFVQAGAFGTSVGRYDLRIRRDDAPGDLDLATAPAIGLSGTGDGSQAGTIEVGADRDVYQFTANAAGVMTLTQRAAGGSSLDSILTVFNENGVLIESNDDSGGSLNSQVSLFVFSGRSYFVEASAYYDSTGAYLLDLDFGGVPPDDFGNDFASASTLPVSQLGFGNQPGRIETAGDVDMFRVVAPLSGNLAIAQNDVGGSGLDTFLTVFDAAGNQLAQNDDGSGFGYDSFVELAVTAGQVLFVEAGAFGTSVGLYELLLATTVPSTDDFGNTLAAAQTITLDPSGAGTQRGRIEMAGDLDVFQFVAPFSGGLMIEQFAYLGGSLDGFLTIRDGGEAVLVDDDDSGTGVNPLVQFGVTAGATYFVEADAFGTSVGEYVLSFRQIPGDDLGNSFADAYVFGLPVSGTGALRGTIEVAGDQDMIRFVAPATGTITVDQAALGASALDTFLFAYDSVGTLLDSNDDTVGTDSQVSFAVTAGGTYFVQADAFGSSTGAYDLRLGTDDAGDTMAAATSIVLTPSAEGSQAGTIGLAGDVDMFQFVAPLTGTLTIDQVASPGSSLDSVLTVFDGGGLLLAQNDDSLGTVDSRVTVAVTAGASYFVQAGAFGTSTGAYFLTIRPNGPDDFANTFGSAFGLNLPASGAAAVRGVIEVAGDQDMFRFVAPATGTMTVDQAALGASSLDTYLFAYDSVGSLLDSNDDTVGTDSRVSFAVTAGGTYFVQADAFGTSTGAYEIRFSLPAVDDYGDTFPAGATAIGLAPSGAGGQSGVIETAGDLDTFSFVGPFTGTMTIDQLAAAGSLLDSFLSVYDSSGTLLDSNDDTFGVDSQVMIAVTAGATYFVEADAFGASTGGYDLTFRAAMSTGDDAGDTFATATPIVLDASGSAGRAGTLETIGDLDVYSVVATSSGVMVVTQTAAVGSGMDSFLSISDSSGNLIATVDDVGASFDSLAKFSVTGGETYFIESSAFAGSGGYDLSIETVSFSGTRLSVLDLDNADGSGLAVTPARLVSTLLGFDPNVDPSSVAPSGVLSANGINVLVSSISYTGANAAAGLFTGGDGVLDVMEDRAAAGFEAFESGIVLSSGSVANVVGPNYDFRASADHALPGSTLLEPLSSPTNDAAVLSFSFIPTVNVVRFQFVFGSEEYLEFVNSGFNDVFGFFVNGIDYARVPGTGTHVAGTGEIISIDSLNNARNGEFFINNSFLGIPPYGPIDVEMDGLTTVLTIAAPVNVGQVNTMSLAIADVSDHIYDSSVFVRGLEVFEETVDPDHCAALLAGFTQFISNGETSGAGLGDEAVHQIIHEQFVNALIKCLDLVGDYLIIPIDPIDFTLTTPTGQQISSTGGATVNSQVGNSFFVSDGVNEVLVIPNAQVGQYSLQLTGVGSGDFRWGASYVSAAGEVTSILLQGRLASTGASTVLDFRNLDGRTEFQSFASSGAGPSSTSEGTTFAGALTPTLIEGVQNALALLASAGVTVGTELSGSTATGQDAGGGRSREGSGSGMNVQYVTQVLGDTISELLGLPIEILSQVFHIQVGDDVGEWTGALWQFAKPFSTWIQILEAAGQTSGFDLERLMRFIAPPPSGNESAARSAGAVDLVLESTGPAAWDMSLGGDLLGPEPSAGAALDIESLVGLLIAAPPAPGELGEPVADPHRAPVAAVCDEETASLGLAASLAAAAAGRVGWESRVSRQPRSRRAGRSLRQLRAQARRLGVRGAARMRRSRLESLLADSSPPSDALTVKALRRRARTMGISGCLRMNKSQLVRAIREQAGRGTTGGEPA